MRFKDSNLYRYCRNNGKKVIMALLAALLIVAAGLYVTYGNSPYITEDGKVKAIVPGDRTSIGLKVKGTKGSETVTEDVRINFRKEKEEADVGADQEGSKVKADINAVALNLGQKENLIRGKIVLPEKLKDGTRLEWQQERSWSWLAGFLVFPMLVYGGYRGEKGKRKKAEDKLRDDFTKSLPAFSNEIILLLESGHVFHDAFMKIADSYSRYEEKDFFRETVVSIRDQAEKSNREIVEIMKEESLKLRNRNFIRLTAIIEDSHYKGTALIEKMRAEGDLLWNERKNRAIEKGKMTETRLTGPMALLLLILITITIAPAVLKM